jgi:hypothetical protein
MGSHEIFSKIRKSNIMKPNRLQTTIIATNLATASSHAAVVLTDTFDTVGFKAGNITACAGSDNIGLGVIPEPTAALPGSLGLLAPLRRRR